MLLEGGGLVNVAAADDPKLFTDPDLALVRVPRHDERQRAQGPAALAQRRGRRLRDVVGLARRPGRELGRLGHSGRLARHRRSGRDRRRADRRLGDAGLPERRRLRVRRPPARRRPRSRSLLLPRDPAADRPRAAGRDQARPDRRHEQGHELRQRLPLSGRSVRAAVRLHRPGDARGRRRARLHRPRQRPRGERGRGRGRERPRRAGRAVVPGLAERGRRPGLPGDAAQRERAHVRVRVRQRRHGSRLPARGPLLRRRRLPRRPVHGRAAARAVPAPLLAQRRHAAEAPLPDRARDRGPARCSPRSSPTGDPESTRSRS